MFDRFQEGARDALARGREEALRHNHDYIGTEHLLLGLAGDDSGVAGRVFAGLSIDASRIREVVETMIEPGTRSLGARGQLPFLPDAKRVLERSLEAASELGDSGITTGHLLLGLLAEGQSVGARALRTLGVDATAVRAEVGKGGRAADPRGARGDAAPSSRGPAVFSRLSDRARRAFGHAREEALRLGHDAIGAEHLLVGLVEVASGVAADALRGAGVERSRAQAAVEKFAPPGPQGADVTQVPFSSSARRVLEYAVTESDRRGGSDIGTGLVLLGLVQDAEGTAVGVLRELGVDPASLRADVLARIDRGADD